MTLTFLGHAAFLAEGGGKRVIFDPFITGNPKAPFPVDRVPRLDAILLSHGHSDHLGDAIPLAKRDQAIIVSAYELVNFCVSQGAPGHKMQVGGTHRFPFGIVKLVPAIHGGAIEGSTSREPNTTPCGIVLTLDGVRVYHAGDTALTMDMQLLHGAVDVMLVPIGDNYTMGVEDAVRAVGFVEPRVVIPMHYNTWDAIAADPQQFRRLVGTRAEVVILEPGKPHTLS
ncbi:MAG TPA: metal-dependent hydrolase [Gemmatimonadales bacterium]|nr:metal-dependent hydrolase [Gemmatimonadales bacterium]